MTLTPYHAKYFAHDLTRRATNGMDRLSMSLFDAAVDLNPHQIEAALFALQSPLSKGVILADEVGLGKTIEAGIVLCQFWAERKRRLIVICPASLRRQWAQELTDKFNVPTRVLDAKAWREAMREGRVPLTEKVVLIMSVNYANAMRDELKAVAWDLVVIDEAHKLRNAYRPSNKVGQGVRWATEDCRKLLLTATPLQNSLLELYGLSTLIDEHLFGDLNSFRAQFASAGSSLAELRQRLSGFCRRTLRKQVTEYIRYTERRPITRPFTPTDAEHALYEAVSAFLQREDSYALPERQRHLTALVLRKLLASSSQAVAATLDVLRIRLETLRDEKVQDDPEFTSGLLEAEEFDDDLLDEILAVAEVDETPSPARTIDRQKLREEIALLQRLADWARRIGTDTKAETLLSALDIGFEQMAVTGAARKALIFTESRRTQDYLKSFLESQGYAGQVVLFNGSNGGPETSAIYERWLEKNRESGRDSGSRAIDVRTDPSLRMIFWRSTSSGGTRNCLQVYGRSLPGLWRPAPSSPWGAAVGCASSYRAAFTPHSAARGRTRASEGLIGRRTRRCYSSTFVTTPPLDPRWRSSGKSYPHSSVARFRCFFVSFGRRVPSTTSAPRGLPAGSRGKARELQRLGPFDVSFNRCSPR
ncbi:MAG: DEAD/DEAH box helicase [Gemmatimonas sp.]|nr:DEAD/DEAH box helicase [Gemmatimonas sp.]